MLHRFYGDVLRVTALTTAICTTSIASTSIDINLSGGEHEPTVLPGNYVDNYRYPSDAELEEKADLGFDRIRLNLRNERLQHCAWCPLDPIDLERLHHVVDKARALGMGVLLDNHNYGHYYNNPVDPAEFADFWQKLASEFNGDAEIWFGLNNEPQGIPMSIWKSAAQAAINSIRTVSDSQKILISGTRWANAHRHFDSDATNESNADMFLTLTDPGSGYNLVSEVHAYPDLDTDGPDSNVNFAYAGDDNSCESITILSDNIQSWTSWLRSNGLEGYVGEYGVTDNSTCLSTLSNFLSFVDANDDVILGVAIWAGGERLGSDYRYMISSALDKGQAQLNLLAPYLDEEPGTLPPIGEIVDQNATNAWYLPGDGRRAWINQSCADELEADNMFRRSGSWNVDLAPLTGYSIDCHDIPRSTPPIEPPLDGEIVDQNADNAWYLPGDGRRAWINQSCANDLEADSMPRRAGSWNADLGHLTGFSINCADIPRPEDTNPPPTPLGEIVDQDANNSWYLPGDGQRAWINPTCADELEAGGMSRRAGSWNADLGHLTGFSINCVDIPWLEDTNPLPATLGEIVDQDANNSWYLPGDGQRAWINPTCADELEAGGMSRRAGSWNTDLGHLTGFSINCDSI